jgi:hypothetical protein
MQSEPSCAGRGSIRTDHATSIFGTVVLKKACYPNCQRTAYHGAAKGRYGRDVGALRDEALSCPRHGAATPSHETWYMAYCNVGTSTTVRVASRRLGRRTWRRRSARQAPPVRAGGKGGIVYNRTPACARRHASAAAITLRDQRSSSSMAPGLPLFGSGRVGPAMGLRRVAGVRCRGSHFCLRGPSLAVGTRGASATSASRNGDVRMKSIVAPASIMRNLMGTL